MYMYVYSTTGGIVNFQFLSLPLCPELGVEGGPQDTSPPDSGKGVGPSPDGTEGGAPSSDKTSPSLDKTEPSTDPAPGAVVVSPDGSGQAVGAPEETGKGNIEEDVALHFQVVGSSCCIDIVIMLLPLYVCSTAHPPELPQ